MVDKEEEHSILQLLLESKNTQDRKKLPRISWR